MSEDTLNNDPLADVVGQEYHHESADFGASDMVGFKVELRRADLDAALSDAAAAAVLVAWIASHLGA